MSPLDELAKIQELGKANVSRARVDALTQACLLKRVLSLNESSGVLRASHIKQINHAINRIVMDLTNDRVKHES